MTMGSALARIPVVRILVPFTVGILIHSLWHCLWAPLGLIVLSAAFYLVLSLISRAPQRRLRNRYLLSVPLIVAAIALGWLCAIVHCPPQLSQGQRNDRLLLGRVSNLDYTDFSMRLTVDVLDSQLPRCKVLISTRGCDYTMQAGDLVAWPAALNEVANLGNPGEMDYAAYLLANKGIRYQQHLPVGQAKRVGHSPTLSTLSNPSVLSVPSVLSARMANARRHLLLQVFNSHVSPAAQHFIAALLLGESGSIDKATRQEFSAAGVAHVLALSGLHVGIIALIIWWLLFPLDYLRLKKMRLLLTIAAIALFTAFTGLSPSVVRSAIMIGMVFVSFIFYRRSMSLNALSLAALVILVFSPSAVYSVGFQLSFITVASILLFARVPQWLMSGHRWVNHLSATVITSLVAMLATVALSAHYFHTVSLMSVLSNLLILPLLPLFLALGALFLLVTAAGMHWQVLDGLLDTISNYIRWAVTSVNALPLSHIKGVYVSTFGVIAYFVVMALVVLWFNRRRFGYLLGAGCALAMLLAHSLLLDCQTPRQGLVVFNSFSSTPILYYENGKGYVWMPDDAETDSASFARYYEGFLARHNINELAFVNDSSLHLGHVMISPPIAHLMGRRLLVVGNGRWKQASTNHRLAVDDLIVTKRFRGSLAWLQELYRFDRIVLTGALQDKDRAGLLKSCDSLNVPVHDLHSAGALVVTAP